MADKLEIIEEPSFDEFLACAKKQIPVTSEPKNGGASVAKFFQALRAIDNDYKPNMVISLRQSKEA